MFHFSEILLILKVNYNNKESIQGNVSTRKNKNPSPLFQSGEYHPQREEGDNRKLKMSSKSAHA